MSQVPNDGSGQVPNSPPGGVPSSGLFGSLIVPPSMASSGLTTWMNQGAATVNNGPTGIGIRKPFSAGVPNVSALYKPAPAAPFTITALVTLWGDSAVYSGAGIGWLDPISGNFQILDQFIGSGPPYTSVNVENWNNPGSLDSGPYISTTVASSYPVWFQIEDDGTNVIFRVSNDGVNFSMVYTKSRSSGWMANVYSDVGFFVNSHTASNAPDVIGTLLSWVQS